MAARGRYIFQRAVKHRQAKKDLYLHTAEIGDCRRGHFEIETDAAYVIMSLNRNERVVR